MGILDKTNYHFIGIGGIGISAIARMLQMQGKNVSGSDGAQSEITDELEKLGIKISIGQKAENLPENTEIVVYTVAIPEDNPEMQEARRRSGETKSAVERTSAAKRPARDDAQSGGGQVSGTADFVSPRLICISYPEFLGELSKNMFTIAISGTHGKTTTTAMVGHILEKAKMDPTIIVGSKMLGENGEYSNFHAGKSEYLVVEACEYKRSFLNLSPKILVITNIEADHLDYYKDIEDIKSAFREMEQKVPKDGFVIKENEYKEVASDFHLVVPGKHNILNAKAAIKAVEKIGISNEKAKEYLQDFKGTWRRQEYKGEIDGSIYYDDYAHHPTEIRATLEALKEKHPERKLVAVFEPHQELRTKLLFDDFVDSLEIADQVFIAPIYINKEVSDGSVTNQTLADAINKYAQASAVNSVEELEEKITHPNPRPNAAGGQASLTTREGQDQKLCIAMLGAGNIYKWTKEILAKNTPLS